MAQAVGNSCLEEPRARTHCRKDFSGHISDPVLGLLLSFQFFRVSPDFVKMKFDNANHDRAHDHDCRCRILFSALHVQRSRSHVTHFVCDGPRLSQAIALWASTVTFATEYLPFIVANLRSRWEMGYGQFGAEPSPISTEGAAEVHAAGFCFQQALARR